MVVVVFNPQNCTSNSSHGDGACVSLGFCSSAFLEADSTHSYLNDNLITAPASKTSQQVLT